MIFCICLEDVPNGGGGGEGGLNGKKGFEIVICYHYCLFGKHPANCLVSTQQTVW